jgi:hypothetical protein
MADGPGNLPRRRLILAAFGGLAARLTCATIFEARAQQKMSQPEAKYQDSPKDIHMCAVCAFFEPPESCDVVEGDISPAGWCEAFVLAD